MTDEEIFAALLLAHGHPKAHVIMNLVYMPPSKRYRNGHTTRTWKRTKDPEEHAAIMSSLRRLCEERARVPELLEQFYDKYATVEDESWIAYGGGHSDDR